MHGGYARRHSYRRSPVNLARLAATLKANPRYVMMRGAARFRTVNGVVKGAKGLIEGRSYARLLEALKGQLAESLFKDVDIEAFVAALNRDGCAFGLTLSPAIVDAV